jgi:outer membrane protein insertion porin family
LKIFLLALFIINVHASYLAKDITYSGLTQISQKIANETLNIKKGDSYSDKEINTALKEFYSFNYFNDISIYNNNDILHIKFTEKPFIINLEMTGYKSSEDDLKNVFSIMNIKKGNMFSKEKVNNSKKLLLNLLKEEGFAKSVVEVDIVNINNQSVSVTYNVNKGDEIIIKKVNYIGAKSLEIDDFELNTANKEEDLVSWWFGQNDGIMQFSQMQYESHRIKDTYFKNGFLDVKVQPAYTHIDFNTNKADIDFIINEGKQYKSNNITVYINEKIIKLDTINKKLLLKKDKIFNISHLRKDIDMIKTAIANKGYAYAKVSYDIRKNKKNNTTDIIFNVIEGDKVYINDVIIQNNNRTLDRVIRRNVYLAPKDLFNLTDYKDSKSKLSRSGFFTNVNIIKKRISKNSMDLIVDVDEAPTGNLVAGGGYGSYDGWMLNASVNDKNIFGSGIDLELKFEYSKRSNTATIAVNNPSINDSIYSGSFKIYKTESTITADTNSTNGDETTLTSGLSLGVGRSLNRNTRIGAIYSLEDENVNYELNTSKNNSYITSAIKPYINYSNTDAYYVPRSGIQAGTSLKFAGLGGDAKYVQSDSYFKYYYGLEDKIDYDLILRYKTNINILNSLGNIQGKTFYLGGPSSLRGYESYAFAPDNKETNPYKQRLTNTIELSLPLLPKAKMRWALFYDYAMIGENKFDQIKKSGYGVSINWYSPVGPLQFIFSRAQNPSLEDESKTSNFEFSLGGRF